MGTTLARLKSLCPTVSVGVLSADLMNLGSELERLEAVGVGVVHVDVMDGCFCPRLTVGDVYVKGLKTGLLKDAHLMVREPLDQLKHYVDAGADMVTVHIEAAVHIHRVLQRLGDIERPTGSDEGVVRGVALNPGTPLEWLTDPLLAEVDVVSLLGVDPGWSGQEMAPATIGRAKRVKERIASFGKDILLCVDGGVTRDNAAELAAAGADIVAAGSAVFAGGAVEENFGYMLEAIRGRAAG